jgi:NitT/TauT family transport system permease protein
MLQFFLIAAGFAAVLTAVIAITRLRVRETERHIVSLGLVLGAVAIIAIGWWLGTRGVKVEDRLIHPSILPSPVEVIKAFPRLHTQQELVRSIFVSFTRVTIGFTLAMLFAIPLGIYMAAFPPIESFFRPLELVSSYVPVVVFLPLTMSWWGVDETQKVGFLAICCFISMLPLVIKTVRNVPQAYLDVAVTKGASQWQLVFRVLLPVASSHLWDHMRGMFGVGWSWIIMAEVAGATRGLGHLADISNRRNHTDAIFAVVIVIVIVAIACDYLWKTVGKLLFPYREK